MRWLNPWTLDSSARWSELPSSHGQRLFQPNAGEIVKSQYFRYLQISSDQTSGKRHVFPEPENFLRSHEKTQDFLGLACFDWFPD